MGTDGDFGTGCSRLLENPVLFLLFSSQAKAEFSMLLNRMGNLDRCIVMQAYDSVKAQIDDGRVVGIELGGPGPGAPYRRQLAAAVRRTKLHKYCRGKDITVCAILEGSDDYSRERAVCERVYNDLKSAYRNHVYVDFYVMAKEPFVPGGGLELQALIDGLKPLAGEDWARYIFLVSDITNEERLVEKYSERFETVLDSIVLTNCRSSSGAGSAYIHERLLEESEELGSKLLALGRVRNENRILLIIRGSKDRSGDMERIVFSYFKQRALLRVRNTTPEHVELIYEMPRKVWQMNYQKDVDISDALYALGGTEYVNTVTQSDEISG